MSIMKSPNPQKKLRTAVFILVVLAIALVAGGYMAAPRFEREAPVITVTPDSAVLGQAPIEISVTDRGAGL